MTPGQKSAARWLVGWTLVVFAAGFGLAYLLGDSKVEALQHYSDSVTVAAKHDSALANVFADSMAGVVDSLQKSKRPVTIKISQDSALEDSAARAVARAQTAADSNKAYAIQVLALKSEVAGLRANARTDTLSLAKAMFRGDSLQRVVNAQTTRISNLNIEIQALTPRTPKWLRVSLRVAELAVAFKAGMEYGQAHP